jgi:hypothetical protein
MDPSPDQFFDAIPALSFRCSVKDALLLISQASLEVDRSSPPDQPVTFTSYSFPKDGVIHFSLLTEVSCDDAHLTSLVEGLRKLPYSTLGKLSWDEPLRIRLYGLLVRVEGDLERGPDVHEEEPILP